VAEVEEAVAATKDLQPKSSRPASSNTIVKTSSFVSGKSPTRFPISTLEFIWKINGKLEK
jgi:hypothetical protein